MTNNLGIFTGQQLQDHGVPNADTQPVVEVAPGTAVVMQNTNAEGPNSAHPPGPSLIQRQALSHAAQFVRQAIASKKNPLKLEPNEAKAYEAVDKKTPLKTIPQLLAFFKAIDSKLDSIPRLRAKDIQHIRHLNKLGPEPEQNLVPFLGRRAHRKHGHLPGLRAYGMLKMKKPVFITGLAHDKLQQNSVKPQTVEAQLTLPNGGGPAPSPELINRNVIDSNLAPETAAKLESKVETSPLPEPRPTTQSGPHANNPSHRRHTRPWEHRPDDYRALRADGPMPPRRRKITRTPHPMFAPHQS